MLLLPWKMGKTNGRLPDCQLFILNESTSGIGAWKREFIDKRQIELAKQALAKFLEVRDAVAFIRDPLSIARCS